MSAAIAAVAASPFRANAARLWALAWPVFVGQIAVMAFGVMDTVLTGRYSADDLAAMSVGSAIYVTLFVSGMGVVMALGPIIAQLYGAGRLHDIGREMKQGLWLVIGMSLVGGLILAFPHAVLALTGAPEAIQDKAVRFLRFLAFGIPAALGFQAFRALSNAISRPKFVMAIQLIGLVLKVPASILLIRGATLSGLTIPAFGGPGGGLATSLVLWCMFIATVVVQRRDPAYRSLGVWAGGIGRPDWPALRQLLRLGLPMGGSYAIEVTGFVFMSLFIIRFGSPAAAGHQIVANIVSVLFMLPLAVSIASSTLVAQRIGARDLAGAHRIGRDGVICAVLVAVLTSSTVWLSRDAIVAGYTDNPAIAAVAVPLLAWVVMFHVGDAFQTVTAFIVRAYKVAAAPMVIYVVAMWGVGLGGGWFIAYDVGGFSPAALQGPAGFWCASSCGLVTAGVLMSLLRRRVERRAVLPAATAG